MTPRSIAMIVCVILMTPLIISAAIAIGHGFWRSRQ